MVDAPAALIRETPRAFDVLTRVPPGARLVLVADDYAAPHLNPGEFAIVAPLAEGARLRDGDAVAIRYTSGRTCCVRITRHNDGPLHGTIRHRRGRKPEPCWYTGPMKPNDPASWDRRARGEPVRVLLSDGPMYESYLRQMMLGRVIGVFRATQAEPVRSA